MSIVFIGTPAFAVPCLRRLLADGHAITAVITQPDRAAGRGRLPRAPAVKLAAQEAGLSLLQPPSLRDPEVLAQLSALAPEVVVAVAYGQLLRQAVLAIPPKGVLNVHPSLLPRWRGASPIPAAILAGDRETGVTIMLMDAGRDSGPVLAHRRSPIGPTDSAGTLSTRLSEVGADLLGETLPRWLSNDIEPAPQNEAEATTSPLLQKEDGAIDWTLPAADISRRVRAYNPWPGAYSMLGSDLIHIWKAWPLEKDTGLAPGTVVALTPDPETGATFAVQTGDGLLAIVELQRAGRRALPAAEFLRGMPALIGRRFEAGR